MHIFTPYTDNLANFYEKGKFILVWRLTLLFGVVFTLLTIIFSGTDTDEAYVYSICTIIAFLALLYLKIVKKSRPVYFFLAITGMTITFYTSNYYPELMHISDFIWLIMIVLFSFFGLGKKYGLLFLGIAIFIILYFTFFSVNTNIQHAVPLDQSSKIGLALELSIATFSIAYIMYQFLDLHEFSYSGLSIANKELKQQNAIIKKQNTEKTTLVQEVHHRVKNNLQIIISLLRLQKGELKNEESKKQFTEAINRIVVMASIHKKLYKDQSFTEVEIENYLRELIEDIITLSALDYKIAISIHSDIKKLSVKTTVPLGLLINELVSNSIQHGFTKKTDSKISIRIEQKQNSTFQLGYSDNGIWINPNEETASFGLELIEILTTQLDGKYKREIDSEGTHYLFDFVD